MSVPVGLLGAFTDAIAPLPSSEGGRAIIAVVDSTPPAMAMLATGSVYSVDGLVRCAVEARSSVAQAGATSATLLVVAERTALRVSLAPLSVMIHDDVAVVEGPIVAIRPSIELPWSLELSFLPTGAEGGEAYLEYWRACRAWLADPESGPPPRRPAS